MDVLAVMLPRIGVGVCFPGAVGRNSMPVHQIAALSGCTMPAARRELRKLEALGMARIASSKSVNRGTLKRDYWQLTDAALANIGPQS